MDTSSQSPLTLGRLIGRAVDGLGPLADPDLRLADADIVAQLGAALDARADQPIAGAGRPGDCLEALPLGVAATMTSGEIVCCNPAFAAVWGRAGPLDLAGANLYSLIADVETQDAMEDAQRILVTGGLPLVTRRARLGDGRRALVQVGAALLVDNEERARGVLWTARAVHSAPAEDGAAFSVVAGPWLQDQAFQMAFDHAPIGMVMADLEGRCLAANSAFCAMIGYTADELIGRLYQPFTHPDDRSRDLAIRQAISDGHASTHALEKRYLHKDGRIVWAHLVATLVRGEGGSPSYVITQIQDITQRKETEEALRASQERLRAVVEDQTELICRSRPDAVLTFVNPAYCRYFGQRPEELIGRSFMTLVPEEERELTERAVRSLSPDHPVNEAEHQVVLADGQRRWMQWVDRVILDEGGRVAELQSVGRDITEQKLAERALRESEERYRRIVELSPDLIGIAVAGRVAFINTSGARLLRAAHPDQLIGHLILDLVHPDSRAEAARHLGAMMERSEPTPLHEECWQRLDGQAVEVEVVAVPLVYEGRPAVQVVARDITERKQAVAALVKSESLYRSLVETSPNAIVQAGLDGRLAFCNRQALQLLGVARQEAIQGAHALAAVAPRDRRRALEFLAAVRAQASACSAEFTLLKKSGQPFIAEISASLVRDGAGRPTALICVLRDITERKRGEAAERSLRVLAEALRDTAAALTGTLDIEEVLDRVLTNAGQVVPHAAANILLLEPPCVVGTRRDWKSSEHRLRVARSRGYAAWGVEDWARSHQFQLADAPIFQGMIEAGQPRIVSDTSAYPGWLAWPEMRWLRSYVGAPIVVRGAVVGFLNLDSATPHFFTEEHAHRLRTFADQAAIALQNAELYQETVRSYDRLALAYRAGVALAQIGSEEMLRQEIVQWACRLGDADMAELTIAQVGYLIPVALAGLPDEFLGGRITIGDGLNGRAAQTRKPQHASDYAAWEDRLVSADIAGIASAIAVPLVWEDRLVGTLGVSYRRRRRFGDEDVHLLTLFGTLAVAALEQRRAVAEARAREAEARALTTQLAGAREEERNRIAELLRGAVDHYLVELEKNQEAIQRLVSPDAPQRELVDASAGLLQQTSDLIRSMATDLDSKILDENGVAPASHHYTERLSRATGLPVRLHVTGRVRRLPIEIERVVFRALKEALSNVLRHAQAKTVDAQLHIGLQEARLTVYDDGVGFDPWPLFAVSRRRQESSGLQNLKYRVQALGGALTVDSTLGGGTTLVVEIPVKEDVRPEGTRPKVLVVDSHDVMRRGLTAMLTESGDFVCLEARDGPEAVRQAELARPDAVIIDAQLSGFGGIEATRQITGSLIHVGVIVLSRDADRARLEESLAAGAHGFVLKSDDSQHVFAALQAVLSGDMYVSPLLAEAWEKLKQRPAENLVASLTQREHGVMDLVVNGYRNRDIADQLRISVRTVEVHRKNIMDKLGAKSLAQLVQLATNNGPQAD